MFSELCFCVGSTRVSDEFCMLQAPYRVTGFIWHGHEHYVAYLLSGRRWHCLDDAVVSEVDVAALPSQACMVFLQKAVRLSQKVAGAGPRAAGRVPHPIWMQLPEVLAQAAMLPACRLGSFAKRVARKRAIRNGEQRSSSRQQQRSGKQGSGRPQKQRSGRPQKQRSGRPQKQRSGRPQKQRSGRPQKQRSGRPQKQRSGRPQKQRSGRRQKQGSQKQSSGRPQKQRSGRPQKQRSGRPQNQRSGRSQKQRSGRDDCREAGNRQANAFSATAWSSNMDAARGDVANEVDNPVKRFMHARRLQRRREKESIRLWPQQALQLAEQPCLLCDCVAFRFREELLDHIDEVHGGLQSYRNAFLHLESLCPHVVVGSEVLRLQSVCYAFCRFKLGLEVLHA